MSKYRNEDWLREKYVDERMSGTEISEVCDVDPVTIYNWLRKFNIKVRHGGSPSNHLSLTDELLEFLDGLLLGDGCVSPNRKSVAYLHTDSHKEYLEWLTGKLDNLGIERSCLAKEENESGEVFKYKSRSYIELARVRKRWYPNGSKRIPLDIRITPVVLMNWYTGDGCLRESANLLATGEQTRENLSPVVNKLEKIGIECTINSLGIRIKNKSMDRFFKYLSKAERPPCYDYKFPN